MPSRIFRSLNLLQDFAVFLQLGQVIFAMGYFFNNDSMILQTFLSSPDLVIGMPDCREMFLFILSMPNIRFREKLTPGIFMTYLFWYQEK